MVWRKLSIIFCRRSCSPVAVVEVYLETDLSLFGQPSSAIQSPEFWDPFFIICKSCPLADRTSWNACECDPVRNSSAHSPVCVCMSFICSEFKRASLISGWLLCANSQLFTGCKTVSFAKGRGKFNLDV